MLNINGLTISYGPIQVVHGVSMNVEEEQRGRAMGIWQLSIGFGVIGSMTLGTLAEVYGASFAQSVFGGIMVLIVALMYITVPKLKEL